MSVEARFWIKVVKGADDECWHWQGGKDTYGYGRFRGGDDGRLVGAHRFAYELLVGPIPDDLTLDHTCRVRSCVNPAHLEPVTQKENVLRGDGWAPKLKAQTHCVHGHPLSGENLFVRDRSGRQERLCRACRREHLRQWRKRRKAHMSLAL